MLRILLIKIAKSRRHIRRAIVALWCVVSVVRVAGAAPGDDEEIDLEKNVGKRTSTWSASKEALHWLSSHQAKDGGWSFDHRDGECHGQCGNTGKFKDARVAATSLALLAYYSATNDRNDRLDAGLNFVLAAEKNKSWEEPAETTGAYSHALATRALCQAYQVAQSNRAPTIAAAKIAEAAQRGLDHLAKTQSPDGGWAQSAGQPCDINVVGAVVLAIRSGERAKLCVDPGMKAAAMTFLDSVQADESGALYVSLPPGKRPANPCKAATAVGLSSRNILGWKRKSPGIEKGALKLAEWRPVIGESTDLYHNYFATRVQFHIGGDSWDRWQRPQRRYLVETQSRAGHESGSWYFRDGFGSEGGGRLYSTALAMMTLNIYTRSWDLLLDAERIPD